MPPRRPSGLGPQSSTRPTREERRREAERVQAEPARAQAPAAAPATKLQARKRQPPKVPLNTYVSAGTQQRVEWFRTQGGYTVTDVVEVALNEFLDKAGVPPPEDLDR